MLPIAILGCVSGILPKEVAGGGSSPNSCFQVFYPSCNGCWAAIPTLSASLPLWSVAHVRSSFRRGCAAAPSVPMPIIIDGRSYIVGRAARSTATIIVDQETKWRYIITRNAGPESDARLQARV